VCVILEAEDEGAEEVEVEVVPSKASLSCATSPTMCFKSRAAKGRSTS
jgi:hypothetical protein